MDIHNMDAPAHLVNTDEGVDAKLKVNELTTQGKRMKQENINGQEDENASEHGVNIDIGDGNSPLPSPEAKALRNPLILTKILKKVESARDVLSSCRLVNSEWRDLSTEILIKRQNFRVRLERDDTVPAADSCEIENGQPQFIKAWGIGKKQRPSLSQLTTLIATATQTHAKFPCVCFSFDGDLNCSDAQEFLNGHGENIKGFTLSGKSDLRFLKKLLLEQAPNVESLELNVHEDEYVADLRDGDFSDLLFPPDSNSTRPTPKLASLITLDLHESCLQSLVQGIVEAAPNLEKCTGLWSIEQIRLLLPRIHILKELHFTPQVDDIHGSFWELLCKKNLQVKTFGIDYARLDFPGMYDDDEDGDDELEEKMKDTIDRISSKFLQSAQRSLKELQFYTTFQRDIQIKWPILEQVEKFKIDPVMPWSAQGHFGLRCPSLKISEHFPALKKLKFHSIDMGKSEQFFNGAALTVQSLSIGKFKLQVFDRCRQTFPNLNKVSLFDMNDFPRVAPKLWNMKTLKSLRLTFLPWDQHEIDAAFTGIEKKICASLDKSGVNPIGDSSEIDKLRVNPSILNLTEELEFLNIRGDPRYAGEDDDFCAQGETVICRGPSYVSFQYAFNLMPKLEVFGYG